VGETVFRDGDKIIVPMLSGHCIEPVPDAKPSIAMHSFIFDIAHLIQPGTTSKKK
jgi:hypothetical protein